MSESLQLQSEDLFDLNRKIAALQNKLKSESLSLKDIHKLTKEAETLLDSAFRVSNVAAHALSVEHAIRDSQKLLQQIEEFREKRRNDDRQKIVQLKTIESKIEDLAFDMFHRTHEENFSMLEAIYLELQAFANQNKDQSYLLDEKINDSFRRLSELHFFFTCPISIELLESSYEENYIQKMLELKEAFLIDKSQGMILFMQLSPKQQSGVYRAAAKFKGVPDGKKAFHSNEISDFERASIVQLYLDDLKHVLFICQVLLYQDETRAFYLLEQLDLEARKEIDQYLTVIASKEENMKKALAHALMTYVERAITG